MTQVSTGEIWLGDLARFFGDLDMMLMWLNMLSNALVIVFGLTAAAGMVLAAFQIQHILFYSAAGAIVAVISHLAFSMPVYGGVRAFLGLDALPYAMTGVACGALYWVTMRFFSARSGDGCAASVRDA
jgi:hypothetical protein